VNFATKTLLCAALIGALSACTHSAQNAGGDRHSWTRPGVLRISIPQEPKTLDSLLSSTATEGFIDRLMFEPLLSADSHGNPVPVLAQAVPTLENGGISRDGLTVTYRLRTGMRWTDGLPVTSGDVKWSWSALMNPANNAVSRHGYDDVASVDTPNATTAIVHLKRPLSSFVNLFFAESDQPYDVLPAHALSKYASINQIPFNERADVSDGPFRLVRWTRGDRIVMSANDGFFFGKPKLSRVEIRVVSDENTAVNLLRAHEIDYWYQASISTFPTFSTVPGTRTLWSDVNGNEAMWLNTSRAPLRDARVRRALAYAVDKAELVKTLTFGQERIASGDLPDWLWATDPGLRPLPYDLQKARTMLHQAGVREGTELLLVTNTGGVSETRAAVQIQSMLQRAGLRVTIKTYPADLLYAPAGSGGIMHGGKWDLLITPWFAGIDPDNSSMFACESMPPNGYNDSRYCTPQMQALQHQALTSYDRAKRRDAYVKIERTVVDDVPQLVFWWRRQPEPVSVDFKGFEPNPVTESWNAWKWSI